MIMVEINDNIIMSESLRSRHTSEMIRAYKALIKRLKAAGIKPKMHILDNEASEALQKNMTKKTVKFQMVPPSIHRQNAAERAMRT